MASPSRARVHHDSTSTRSVGIREAGAYVKIATGLPNASEADVLAAMMRMYARAPARVRVAAFGTDTTPSAVQRSQRNAPSRKTQEIDRLWHICNVSADSVQLLEAAGDGTEATWHTQSKRFVYTLQGEGANVGRPAVFCRFSGCNLWSGRDEDRHDALCQFCDTDFKGTDGAGGGRFGSAEALAAAVAAKWPAYANQKRLVVCTGGEPLLQLDEPLIASFHLREFDVAIETNGTRVVPPGVDWSCVSPKAGAHLVSRSGNELKLIYPQPGASPDRFEDLKFDHFFLQPMDGPDRMKNTELAVRYCLDHPRGASACRSTSCSAFREGYLETIRVQSGFKA